MEGPIQLINIPEDSLWHILVRCDFLSIQRLRKTCHTIRNVIDETKPLQLINSITILGNSARIYLTLFANAYNFAYYPEGGNIQLMYKDLGDGNTLISWHRKDGDRVKIMENEIMLDVFSRDFGTILECKMSKWNEILMAGDEELLETIEAKVLALKSPLKVHDLRINSRGTGKPAIEILQFICPRTLTHLYLNAFDGNWDMSEMVKLEQWKKTKELDMGEVQVTADIGSYSHFDTAKIRFECMTIDDLCKLKEIFLHTHFITKHFEITVPGFANSDIPSKFNLCLGQPYLIQNEDMITKHWYFKRSDNYVVCIKFKDIFDCFNIDIITMEEVPVMGLIF